ncbi:30S ribosomal protein S17 [Candidatus Uhrbacteria bacterium]|nr:30S ribosomal protein S17 [Candidatus Uhrbacteria bacterium]
MPFSSPTRQPRTFRGKVVSDKMDKTIVVQVDRTILHPKYGKRYIRSQRFQVHDDQNAHHIGDLVEFVECRPLSRHKRWRVLRQVAPIA